ncbi:polysaccharide deacetylase family protein [Fibrella aquatilis]|uniref:Polysaccharide deacetylase family protein n=1 Tax=Fibrella aquatilis TaxID=2817059 RepID=A0A939G435_9BACT|nr:polysaccharide deacetylase family protein [Fibrella aquatilis]MBO0931714.1 polysaccharide deacetylase family protein [Fibrella aquatilis]
MPLFLHKSNFLFRTVYPDFWWRIPVTDGQEPTIYLTFDDGPIPGVTEFVLGLLEEYAAQATFFCIGDNVRKHRDVFYKVIEAGHMVGNHTFNHLNGWKTHNEVYWANIRKCERQMNVPTPLFRPPYGRINKSQAVGIQNEYSVIMWDVLTGDFDQSLSPQTVLQKSIQYTEPGSIVVFHDSLKAWPNLQYVLPRYLAHFAQEGYQFRALPLKPATGKLHTLPHYA